MILFIHFQIQKNKQFRDKSYYTLPDLDALINCMDLIMQDKTSKFFVVLPQFNPQEYQNYLKILKTEPMCYEIIKERLENKYYHQLSSFYYDLSCIYYNAKRFNGHTGQNFFWDLSNQNETVALCILYKNYKYFSYKEYFDSKKSFDYYNQVRVKAILKRIQVLSSEEAQLFLQYYNEIRGFDQSNNVINISNKDSSYLSLIEVWLRKNRQQQNMLIRQQLN